MMMTLAAVVLPLALVKPLGAPQLHRAPQRACRPPVCSESVRGGLRLLEWIPSQQLLVGTARFTWNTLWKTMLSELAPQSSEGEYVRPAPQIGAHANGWPSHLPAARGRYHVYIGNACPWCHRVSITLALRGLLGGVSMTKLLDDPERASRGGWAFDPSDPDPLFGTADLRGVYDRCTPSGSYTGRCTAPLLVDLEEGTIISNESGDIVRMLNGLQLPPCDGDVVDLYPPEQQDQIATVCSWVYDLVNNGVYRAGFATKQAAYEAAERDVHQGLRKCNDMLATNRFLCGSTVTAADVWLLPTCLRFDGIYSSIFRCGRRQVRSDYPHIARWMLEMLQLTGEGLFDLQKARESYYTNLFPLNPGGIVPAGPTADDLGFADLETAPGNADRSAFTWRSVAPKAVGR